MSKFPDSLKLQFYSTPSSLYNYLLFTKLCQQNTHLLHDQTTTTAEAFCHGIWRETQPHLNAIMQLVGQQEKAWQEYDRIIRLKTPRSYSPEIYRKVIHDIHQNVIDHAIPRISEPPLRTLFQSLCSRNIHYENPQTSLFKAKDICMKAWTSPQRSEYEQQLRKINTFTPKQLTSLDQYMKW